MTVISIDEAVDSIHMAREWTVPQESSAPTLKDVADLARVSPTTASMALSGRTGSAHLSQACISRVHSAAKHLGYRGNYHARSLASGRAYTIGLSAGAGPVSLIEHDFFNPIIGGVEAATRARGYDMLVIGGTGAMMPLERAFNHLEERRLDALIIVRTLYPRVTPEIQSSRLPIVLLEGADVPELPQVSFDCAPGLIQAVSHLAELGHRRLCWVSPLTELPLTQASLRQHVLEQEVAARGLVLEHLLLQEPTTDPNALSGTTSGYHQAIVSCTLPAATAFLCYNDSVALALSYRLMRDGIDIPGQVSVIGFDDRYGGLMVPPMTTVSHSQRLLGETCVHLALDILDGTVATSPVPSRRVASRLVIRGSTGPCRAGSG
jgi:DNA-binding LacI/PurR family transcriptional regulator